MGKIYYACLIKELKEQRLQLLLIITLMPLVYLLLGFHFENLFISKINFVEKSVLTCIIAAVCAFGCDLLGGEWRRGSVVFLNRLPMGLRSVFPVKIVTFLFLVSACLVGSALVSFTIYNLYHLFNSGNDNGAAYACSMKLAARLREVGTNLTFTSFFLSSSILLLVISCWLKRIGVGLALWVVSLIINFIIFRAVANVPTDQEVTAISLILVHPSFMLLVAYLTFVHGYRFNECAQKIKMLGISATVLLYTASMIIIHY